MRQGPFKENHDFKMCYAITALQPKKPRHRVGATGPVYATRLPQWH